METYSGSPITMEGSIDSQVKAVMVEATRASDEERATFPEVVKMLMGAGLERYHADLVRGERTYYLPNGKSEVVAGHAVGVAPAAEFSAKSVDAAVRAIQAGRDPVPDVLHAHRGRRLRRLYGVLGGTASRVLRQNRRQPCRMVSRRQAREGGVKRQIEQVSPLEAHLGYWLRFVSNQVSHSFAVKLSGRDISVAEWVVLRELYERESMAPSLLAERIGMTRGAVTKLADRLSAKALVTRRTSDEDRRYQALTLTAKGRAIVPRLAGLADQNDAEFFGHLKAAEQETIKATMRDIVRRHGLKSVPVE